MPNRVSNLVKLSAAVLSLTAPAAAAQSSAATAPALRLPANYFSRFGGAEVVTGLDGGVTFGVRGFPLPFQQDVRLLVVKHPRYWEYGLSTRSNDTTLAAGVFDNGLNAAVGIPRLEITHDPWKGTQYSGRLQGSGYYSRFTGGYAFTAAQDRVRVLNNVGVAFQGDVAAPYSQTEIGGGYGRAFGKVNAGFGSAVRLYTFPVQKQAQGSLEFSVNANTTPVAGLTLAASHFERFVAGKVAIPDLNLGRYQETNASITYRLPVAGEPGAFGLGAVRSRVVRYWQDDKTDLYNDVLFRVKALPSLVGASVGYEWTRDGKDNKWLFSLVFLPK
ncbi:hypothetical protein DEIPH_ctg025orf0182 [Deinococcus phoenicis]|uniref:Uncharacterized protein n=1 Tax=Deinococcus phoenicis TaxID=1476583 RepID=A0A016QQF0_9DEIO|nr:hypothetical protein [Deinococcus phoenicis]EYB68313.1 hypothetical protein DEIPH_ctg025orf0182 [Deinococcus phoenicis]